MRWREWVAIGFLVGLAAFMTAAGSLHVPTPLDVLRRMLEPLGRALFEFR